MHNVSNVIGTLYKSNDLDSENPGVGYEHRFVQSSS